MTAAKPQRLKLHSPIGSLLKGNNARIPRPRVIEGDRDEGYLKLIRQLPCLKCGVVPCGEAAHVRMGSGFHRKSSAGMGRKPPDSYALPLCRDCHLTDPDSLHKVGEALFWDRVGIIPFDARNKLYPLRGDFVAMEKMAMVIIAERMR